jgi:hypothetical protein
MKCQITFNHSKATQLYDSIKIVREPILQIFIQKKSHAI